MKTNLWFRVTTLAGLFIKEQLKEPISLFWIMFSPCALFYFFAATRQDPDYYKNDYLIASAWFYAYVSSSVALFGFSFYIIGRRESGFIRSFIYSKSSKIIFLCSHFFAYSLISVIYCWAFYFLTKPPFGNFEFEEILSITIKFYICFIMFCSLGAIFTLLPVNFQNSNTLLSVFSFCMLVFGVMGASGVNSTIEYINSANPLTIANGLMIKNLHMQKMLIAQIVFFFIAIVLTITKYLRVNPIWSRY